MDFFELVHGLRDFPDINMQEQEARRVLTASEHNVVGFSIYWSLEVSQHLSFLHVNLQKSSG
jgi:hypothetical protein